MLVWSWGTWSWASPFPTKITGNSLGLASHLKVIWQCFSVLVKGIIHFSRWLSQPANSFSILGGWSVASYIGVGEGGPHRATEESRQLQLEPDLMKCWTCLLTQSCSLLPLSTQCCFQECKWMAEFPTQHLHNQVDSVALLGSDQQIKASQIQQRQIHMKVKVWIVEGHLIPTLRRPWQADLCECGASYSIE